MDRLLKRAVELGARLAQPGEFSQRAFINGKATRAYVCTRCLKAGKVQKAI